MADEAATPTASISLDQCDGVHGGKPHWTRQRCRLVRLRWQEDGTWQSDTRSLCTDHYRELRVEAEPRHPDTG